MQILTEEELMREWKVTEEKEKRIFKRMLNPNLPKTVCPTHIDPKHVIRIGSSKKFYFDPEKGWPKIITKP
jgi:hypothetical protein